MTRCSALALLRLPLVAALLAIPACGATTGPDYPAGPRILFIGNSLTYEDSLGARVAEVLAQFGDSGVYVRTVGFPTTRSRTTGTRAPPRASSARSAGTTW